MTEREIVHLSKLMMGSEEIVRQADAKAKALGWEDLPHYLELCAVRLLTAETPEDSVKSYRGYRSLYDYEKELAATAK